MKRRQIPLKPDDHYLMGLNDRLHGAVIGMTLMVSLAGGENSRGNSRSAIFDDVGSVLVFRTENRSYRFMHGALSRRRAMQMVFSGAYSSGCCGVGMAII